MKYQANLNLISDSFSGKYNLMYNNELGWSKKMITGSNRRSGPVKLNELKHVSHTETDYCPHPSHESHICLCLL